MPGSPVRMPVYFPTVASVLAHLLGVPGLPTLGQGWGVSSAESHHPCCQDRSQAKANLRSMSFGFLCT